MSSQRVNLKKGQILMHILYIGNFVIESNNFI